MKNLLLILSCCTLLAFAGKTPVSHITPTQPMSIPVCPGAPMKQPQRNRLVRTIISPRDLVADLHNAAGQGQISIVSTIISQHTAAARNNLDSLG